MLSRMRSMTEETWVCTLDEQEEFAKLYKKDKKQWRIQVTKMIRDHPRHFNIHGFGTNDTKYDYNTFIKHFKPTISNDTLLHQMFNDIDHIDSNDSK